MAAELYVIKGGGTEGVELPTVSVTWSGQRYNAARKLIADILYTETGGLKYTDLEEGNTVLFKYDGKELFRGVVFNRIKTRKGTLQFVAYDLLQYLILNRDVYVFDNQRADQIVHRICRDYDIPIGSVANTGVTITEMFTNETTLYDMILTALVNTEKSNGRRFRLTARKGLVNLEEWKHNSEQWVLESGANIIDYSYTTSIDETATRVKLVHGDDDHTITATVTDNSGRSKYGLLQHFERVTDEVNQGQLNTRALNILNDKKGVQKTLDISALGIVDLISGGQVYVVEKDIGVNGSYYIASDTHTFFKNTHQMILKLSEENKMAVM